MFFKGSGCVGINQSKPEHNGVEPRDASEYPLHVTSVPPEDAPTSAAIYFQ